MKEHALLFGRDKALVGVVTDPSTRETEPGAKGSSSQERVGFVILNAGLVHRVGPNRLHVELARRLAERGVVSMRFDFSGIGDSLPRAGARSFAEAALDETRQCLDYLESSRGISRFVLFGICSGADNALRSAKEDPRVRGAVLVEPHAVPTLGYLLHVYKKRLLRPKSWVRFLSGRSEAWIDLLRLSSAQRSTGSVKVSQEFMAPSKRDFVEGVTVMAERGQKLLLVYCSGSPSEHFYSGRVRRQCAPFRRTGAVSETFVSGSDHIFTHRATRTLLFGTVLDWTASLGRP